jgi:legumain
MKISFAVALALLLTLSYCANWAVLVAGSDGFYNYRHQADVFHAYQSLIKKGMNPDNIIVLAYDDIAKDSTNPFPGKVFNKPTYANPGVDVYAGVKIDYKGGSVTPQVFMDVLTGNKAGVTGKGTGRVLESTSADNVFIFFSDHGATGLIAFPTQYLYANDLITTLNKMRGRYSKLVFYLETCESGSMFVNLPKNTNIYALSAAGTSESSWATYCSPDDVIQNKHLGTCLGDLFSVSFIEDIDSADISTETLDTQFVKVKKLTNLSVVMQWGDVSYTQDVVSAFIGAGQSLRRTSKTTSNTESNRSLRNQRPYHIKINYLTNKYQAARTE